MSLPAWRGPLPRFCGWPWGALILLAAFPLIKPDRVYSCQANAYLQEAELVKKRLPINDVDVATWRLIRSHTHPTVNSSNNDSRGLQRCVHNILSWREP